MEFNSNLNNLFKNFQQQQNYEKFGSSKSKQMKAGRVDFSLPLE